MILAGLSSVVNSQVRNVDSACRYGALSEYREFLRGNQADNEWDTSATIRLPADHRVGERLDR